VKFVFGVLTLLSCFIAVQAQAQTWQTGENHGGDQWDVSAGAGVLVAPSYFGDDAYQFMAVPDIRVSYGDTFFASMQDGAGYNIIHTAHWKVGPLLRYDFGRDEDGDSTFRIGGDKTDDLRGLGDVDGSLEIGAYVEYDMAPLNLKVELLQGMGGHEGLVGNASLKYKGRAQLHDKAILYAFGPEIDFADSSYHESYFGVNSRQSAASGLAEYDPGAGVLSYGIGSSAIVPLTDTISTIFFASYNHLGSEAAHSSLVEERGSKHQGAAGAFITYRF
tara:strand:- start:711 stop:1538 length:828 start_codon:yes stop_codon:yes gene_type:complete